MGVALAALLFICLLPFPSLAQGPCGGAELRAATQAALFAGAAEPDLSDDGVVSAADLVAAQALGEPPPCPGAASLDWIIDNRSGRPTVDVQLSGERVACLCRDDSLDDTFVASATCAGAGPAACAGLAGLAPGVWRLELRVDDPDTGQVQRRRHLLVADGVETTRWTAFASVATVVRTDNSGIGSLRNALALAPGVAKPTLIQFDDTVFPAATPTTIGLEFSLPTLEVDDVTVDALDADGLAWNRIVDAQGQAIGVLSIAGGRNHVIGLALRAAGANDRDVLRVGGPGADGNRLERLLVETAASGDGIGIDDGAGDDFGASANVVVDCEVRGADDKGIKVTTGAHARIENSRIGDNRNGGVQATLGGHAWVVDSLIEGNGGGSGQNGMAAQGLDDALGFSSMRVDATLARNNLGNGISARGFASLAGSDSVFAGNGAAGMLAFSDVTEQPAAHFAGSAFVCNRDSGAEIGQQSRVDLGGGPFGSPGANAFSFNGLEQGGYNVETEGTLSVAAVAAQWEHCGNGATCDLEAIAEADLGDGGLSTRVEPATAHRGGAAVRVEEVRPLRAEHGQWVRIIGDGFNVVDAYDGRCAEGTPGDTCVPLRGTCVRLDGRPVPIEALSPTMILVRWPRTCIGPANLTVTVQTSTGATTSAPVAVCR